MTAVTAAQRGAAHLLFINNVTPTETPDEADAILNRRQAANREDQHAAPNPCLDQDRRQAGRRLRDEMSRVMKLFSSKPRMKRVWMKIDGKRVAVFVMK